MDYTKFWIEFNEEHPTLREVGYEGCLQILESIKRPDKEVFQLFRKLMPLAKAFIENELGVELPVIKQELNGRLVNMNGYYQHTYDNKPLKISISRDLIRYHNEDVIFETMAHEFLHYALCHMGKPFDDGDPLFEYWLCKLNLRSNYKESGQSYNYIVKAKRRVKRARMSYGKR